MFDASLRTPTSPAYYSYSSASEEDLKQGLHALAKDTGGEVFFNTNDLTGTLKKVVDNNEVYYAIAYYPETKGGKDKYRRISVRLKNHPDYKVRTQKGYLTSDLMPEKAVAAETPQKRLVNAIVSPLPVTAIGITASADFLETDGDDSQATVQVHIDATTIEYKEEFGRHTFDLDLLIFIFDESGKVAETINHELRGTLTPGRLALAKQNGFRYTTRVKLKPGQYQVRAGAREMGGERVGTATAFLEIPDLKKKKLAISGLFLSEAEAQGDQAAKQGENLDFFTAKVVRGVPVFKKGANLICSFIAYNTDAENEKDSEAMMQLVLTRDGQPVHEGEWKPIKSNLLARGETGSLVGLQLKLTVAPGLYELGIKVKEPKSKKFVQQAVLFEVEP
jgi:hypothetical protein